MTPKLGRLEKVALREVWPHEAGDFTPWLAQDHNLTLLGDTLGLELVLEAQEQAVGSFKADILAKDVSTDHGVLIENQLERTDHAHLGQVLTYAAGLDAFTIVWVAERFTDEHRAALDWLNKITDEQFQFFGLEVELWRIGTSEPAPKFNVVSRPNEWSRTVTAAARQIPFDNLTETKALQLEYWTAFRNDLLTHSRIIKPQKPYPQHWADYHIGHSDFNLSANIDTRKNLIRVLLNITGPQAKSYFQRLQQDQPAIAAEMKEPLDWRELPNRKSCQIMVTRSADPTQRDDWPAQHAWLREQLEAFYRAFHQRVRNVAASTPIGPADDEEA